jgi:hypothetical protein
VFSNRDRRTLLDKMVLLIDSLGVNEPFYFVADAYYATGKIVRGLLAKGNHLVTRVKSNSVAWFPATPPPPNRPRPRPSHRRDHHRRLRTQQRVEFHCNRPSPVGHRNAADVVHFSFLGSDARGGNLLVIRHCSFRPGAVLTERDAGVLFL